MKDAQDRGVAAFERGDYDVAFREWLRAAQEGNAAAQQNVAAFYASGSGVAQDHGEALKWWRRAAEQGSIEAQYSIGTLYANGWGVPTDQREAARYWCKAAEHGHSAAQYNLGLLYMKGEAVPPDVIQAHILFGRAAAGYQEQIASGFDMRKHRQDAIRQRRIAGWLRLMLRCQLFLASVGLGRYKPQVQAASPRDGQWKRGPGQTPHCPGR